MARKPFVIIDAEILSSSVWAEAAHVRLVWLTMLILCDTEGYVGAAIPGIARAAGVTVEQTREALERLKAPDPDSRTKTDEGRRIREVERGFQVLNFKEHLARLSRERQKSRERVRRWREKKRAERYGNVTVTAEKREQGTANKEKVVPNGIIQSSGGTAPKANPLVRGRREALELECLALVSRLAELTNQDPIEVIAFASGYKGAATTKLNPATMSDDRLANTVRDLRRDVKAEELRREKREAIYGKP